jgi:hypothetical protein
MARAVQIALGALLIAGVLGGISAGAYLLLALIARGARPDRPEVAALLVRRAARAPVVLGVLAIVFPIASAFGAHAWTFGSWSLVTGGLLLIAGGRTIAVVGARPRR